MSKSKPSLFKIVQKMRIPSLGAVQHVGSQAKAWAKFNVPIGFGGGSYYILEFNHDDTAFAIHVREKLAGYETKHITVAESADDPSMAVEIDGTRALLEQNYQPELITTLYERLTQERNQAEELSVLAI